MCLVFSAHGKRLTRRPTRHEVDFTLDALWIEGASPISNIALEQWPILYKWISTRLISRGWCHRPIGPTPRRRWVRIPPERGLGPSHPRQRTIQLPSCLLASRFHEFSNPTRQRFDPSELTLPYYETCPSQPSHLRDVARVTLLVALKLFLPKAHTTLRNTGELTSTVSMPKTTVHEDCLVTRGENQVRPPGKLGAMQAIPESHVMYKTANSQLGFGVLGSNECHPLRPLPLGQCINHRSLRR